MSTTRQAVRATIVVLAINALLLVLKGAVSSVSESLTIFSETINSLTDLASSIAVLYCVRIARREADENHPFGHSRAEPIAGLITALFSGIMGWEVFRSPLNRLLGQESADLNIGQWALPVLIFTVIAKASLAVYLLRTARETDSPALRASAVDSRNDVLVSILAIVGVTFGAMNPFFDSISALFIGVYILYQAYDVGMENIHYLMGSVPDAAMIERIRTQAREQVGVRDVRDLRAHYVGNFIHVELSILLDSEMRTGDSHDIAEAVRDAVETIPAIDRAFIHVEPVPHLGRDGDAADRAEPH